MRRIIAMFCLAAVATGLTAAFLHIQSRKPDPRLYSLSDEAYLGQSSQAAMAALEALGFAPDLYAYRRTRLYEPTGELALNVIYDPSIRAEFIPLCADEACTLIYARLYQRQTLFGLPHRHVYRHYLLMRDDEVVLVRSDSASGILWK